MVVRIDRAAVDRIDRLPIGKRHRHVGLAKDDGAGGLQALRRRRRLRAPADSLKCRHAPGRRQTCDVVRFLHRHRHAEERPLCRRARATRRCAFAAARARSKSRTTTALIGPSRCSMRAIAASHASSAEQSPHPHRVRGIGSGCTLQIEARRHRDSSRESCTTKRATEAALRKLQSLRTRARLRFGFFASCLHRAQVLALGRDVAVDELDHRHAARRRRSESPPSARGYSRPCGAASAAPACRRASRPSSVSLRSCDSA